MRLRAPFPWFGGKSRVSDLVWSRFGDTPNYIEPFAGSLAVLLGRPTEPRIETVNDKDGHLCNFWRAVQHDPEQVAFHADYPVNECDLHARHVYLIQQLPTLVPRLEGDLAFYDARLAGLWVWGISAWIGGGWCSPEGPWWPNAEGLLVKRPWEDTPSEEAGDEEETDGGAFGLGATLNVERGITRKMPDCDGRGKKGVHAHGAGFGRGGVSRRLPHMLGNKGVHMEPPAGVQKRLPHLNRSQGCHAQAEGLLAWFGALQERLRHVRVCCGDWKRITGPSVTTAMGVTAVFLDPPYSAEADRDMRCYGDQDDGAVAHEVRAWALEHGANPQLRIALCGYDTEHQQLEQAGWDVVAWKAGGGYGRGEDSRALENRHRERVWFSPACLRVDRVEQGSLF